MRKKIAVTTVFLSLLINFFFSSLFQKPKQLFAQTNQNTLGITHVAGAYRLTEEPFLLEGAKFVQNLNTKTIFVYLTWEYESEDYPQTNFGSPSPTTLKDLASRAPFRELFQMDFSTYIITTLSFAGNRGDGFSAEFLPAKPITPEQLEGIKTEHYELTKYLLETYQGTGKKFILKNWEGDWAVRGWPIDKSIDPTEEQLQTAITWFNFRHNGVVQARNELFHLTGVQVFDAVEFNLLDVCRERRPCVLVDVIPYVNCDYLSYSAWETVMGKGITVSDGSTRQLPTVREA